MTNKRLYVKNGKGGYAPAPIEIVIAVADRSLARTIKSASLTSPEFTERFLRVHLGKRTNEVFSALFLDNRHRVIEVEDMFYGTIDGCSVHPREVVRRCLHHNAACVIFAHNHPSGVAEPSLADRAITKKLRDALSLIDVRVLDHFVVGDSECVSFANRGLL